MIATSASTVSSTQSVTEVFDHAVDPSPGCSAHIVATSSDMSSASWASKLSPDP